MKNRIISFHVQEDKAIMRDTCNPTVRISSMELIGGEGIPLIALHDAIFQLDFVYPEVEWEFIKSSTLHSYELVAKLLPYRII